MQRRAFVWGLAAFLSLAVACAGSAQAGEIQVGGTSEVKANSIWFEEAAQLTQWQAERRRGNAKSLAAYEDTVLGKREAWRFINPLAVKVLDYARDKQQVKVEMTTPGRLLGSTWFLDAGALQR
jgi:hypothetical protein